MDEPMNAPVHADDTNYRLANELTEVEHKQLRKLMRACRRDPVHSIAGLLQSGGTVTRAQAELLLKTACKREANSRRARRLAAWLLGRLDLPDIVRRTIALQVAAEIARPQQELEIGYRARPYAIAAGICIVLGFSTILLQPPSVTDALLIMCLTAFFTACLALLYVVTMENEDKMKTRIVIAESLGQLAAPASIEFVTRAVILAERDSWFSKRLRLSKTLRSAAKQVLRAIIAQPPDHSVTEATSHLCWLAEQRDPELAVAALNAIAHSGDGYAMDRVRKVERKTHNQEVEAAAKQALTALAARFPGERLLRPADRLPEELLRPASFSGIEDSDRLLRSASSASEDDQAAPSHSKDHRSLDSPDV